MYIQHEFVEAGGAEVDVHRLPLFQRQRRLHVRGLLAVNCPGVLVSDRRETIGIQDLNLIALLKIDAAVAASLAFNLGREIGNPEFQMQFEIAEFFLGVDVTFTQVDLH